MTVIAKTLKHSKVLLFINKGARTRIERAHKNQFSYGDLQ